MTKCRAGFATVHCIQPSNITGNFAVTQEWKLIDPVGNIQFGMSNPQLEINDIHMIHAWDSYKYKLVNNCIR